MRHSYDKQFRIAADKLVLDDDMFVAVAAKALNIHYNSLTARLVNTDRVLSQWTGQNSLLVSMR